MCPRRRVFSQLSGDRMQSTYWPPARFVRQMFASSLLLFMRPSFWETALRCPFGAAADSRTKKVNN